MIGLVRIALRRPYTMAIAAMLIMLMGSLAVTRMVVDIFPNIDIPVVYVAWNYPGLSAEDMERRVVLVSERAYSTTVNGIERIESHVDPGAGHSQGLLPAGHRYRRRHRADLRAEQRDPAHRAAGHHAAEHDPVQRLERAGGAGHAQQQDAPRAADCSTTALNFLRVGCSRSPGCRSRRPSAASSARSSSTSIPARLSAKGLSQMDVVSALQTTNVIVPAGIARIGAREFNVQLNSSPQTGRPVPGAAGRRPRRHSGAARRRRQGQRQLRRQQTNIVRINGQRASYMPILKNSDASTLAVVDAVRNMLPEHAGHRAGGHGTEDGLRPVGVRARARSRTSSTRRSCPRSWSR